MGYPQETADHKWTYADYCSWPDEERWELIDGVAYNMSPAPSRIHQKISGELFRQISNHLHGRQCEVYSAPFDVRLPNFNGQDDADIETVVQPDIVVVCDPGKLDDRGCKGAPDLVIEILSPATAEHDLKDKFHLYQRVGVKEYWLMHPTDRTTMVFKLGDADAYGRPDVYGSRDRVEVPLLGDLEIDLAVVFTE